jgi:hypothetical protein
MAVWSSVFVLGEILSLGYPKKKKGGREENLNLTRISFDKKWHIKSPYFEGKKKTFARF